MSDTTDKPTGDLSEKSLSSDDKDDEKAPEKVGSFLNFRPLLNKAFDSIDTAYHEKDHFNGVLSQLSDLDKVTRGFKNGDLIIVTGAPASGKSTLCEHFVLKASEQKKKVAYFTPTLNQDRLTHRLILVQSQVEANKLAAGMLDDEDWTSLADGVYKLWDRNIYFNDKCPLSVTSIYDNCVGLRELVDGLDLIVIDDLLFVDDISVSLRQSQGNWGVARALKIVARQLNVPVVVACPAYLSRSQRNSGERANMGDLAGIEDCADVVLVLHRDNFGTYGVKPTMLHRGETIEGELLKIDVAKQRGGIDGWIIVDFFPAFGWLHNQTDSEDD